MQVGRGPFNDIVDSGERGRDPKNTNEKREGDEEPSCQISHWEVDGK